MRFGTRLHGITVQKHINSILGSTPLQIINATRLRFDSPHNAVTSQLGFITGLMSRLE
jgi:hypothetical protein